MVTHRHVIRKFQSRLDRHLVDMQFRTFEMDFPPPYFPGDELSDDHPHDYYPMNMPLDPSR